MDPRRAGPVVLAAGLALLFAPLYWGPLVALGVSPVLGPAAAIGVSTAGTAVGSAVVRGRRE